MSRRAGHSVVVEVDEEGKPDRLHLAGGERDPPHRPASSAAPVVPVLRILTYHREWIGVLDSEPERDVWLVETTDGICELHRLRDPARAAAEGMSHPNEAASSSERQKEKPTTATSVSSESPPPPVPDRWLLARWED